MRPLPPPLLAEPPDPLPAAVGEAMRDVTVQLWADLWQRLERYDQAHERLVALADRLELLLADAPNTERARLRRRLARIRTELEGLVHGP